MINVNSFPVEKMTTLKPATKNSFTTFPVKQFRVVDLVEELRGNGTSDFFFSFHNTTDRPPASQAVFLRM